MFGPLKTWRKWKRKTNLNQRRFAICSALAAASVPSIVMARGHRVKNVPEIPLVLSSETVKKGVGKTSKAVELLQSVGAYDDVEKAKSKIRVRAGKGKIRNRRYKKALGPLIVFGDNLNGTLVRSFKNLPGVELVNVNYLNILQLAPGAHLGRFVVWMDDAFKQLDNIFGTLTQNSVTKFGYKPPRSILTNPNIRRIIGSYEIQSVIRDTKAPKARFARKRNPLRNWHAMVKLNPFHAHRVRRDILANQENRKKRLALLEARRTKDKGYLEANKKKKATDRERRHKSAAFYKLILDTPLHPARPKLQKPAKKAAE